MATAPVDAALGLGSNLGERAAMIESACRAIGTTPGVRLVARAPVIETEALGLPGAHSGAAGGPYLNTAVLVRTTLGARALLDQLQHIELQHGRDREREGRWRPRTLDIDLLLFGDCEIDEEGLRVPHPRLAERLFVLEPLCAVAPGWVIPGLGRTVEHLRERVTI